MFGDLMGNMQEQQSKIQEELGRLEISKSDPEGKIRVSMNGLCQVLDIEIAADLDKEYVEDMLVQLMNELNTEIREEENNISQRMMKDLLPGGLGGLSNLFG